MTRCRDHLGKYFDSIEEMLLYHGVSYAVYRARMKKNLPLEQVLTPNTITVHGKNFNTKTEICDYYGIDYKQFTRRIRQGFSPEDIIDKKLYERQYTFIIDDKHFTTVRELAKYLDLNIDTLKEMLFQWRYKPAQIKKAINRLAIGSHRFRNYKHACEYYHVSNNVLCAVLHTTTDAEARELLIKQSAKRCENYKIKKKTLFKPCVDHLGNHFDSIRDMCKYHGISDSVWQQRSKRRWELKDILTTPVKTFNTESEYARYSE